MYVVILHKDERYERDEIYGPFIDQESAERWAQWSRSDPETNTDCAEVSPLRAPARRDQETAR